MQKYSFISERTKINADFCAENAIFAIFFVLLQHQENAMAEHFTTSANRMKPLVSFIITYYNQPVSMLEKCLDSIFQLPLSKDEREVIIIDDGSAQSPIDQLQQYQNAIVYLRQHNQGVSMARNKGIDLATGTYIQFVDADDYLFPDIYGKCLTLTEGVSDGNHPDMVLFGITTQEEPQEPQGKFLPPQDGASYMRNNNVPGTACGYLFRKSQLNTLRFTENIAYGEDEEFTTLLMLRTENLCPTTYKPYFYRKNPQSATQQKDTEAILKRLDDTHTVIQRLHAMEDHFPPQEREALKRKVAQLTMDYLYNIMTMTHSSRELEKRIQELSKLGLFPLPAHNYTRKYALFCKMVNQKLTRKLLGFSLKVLK